MMEEPTVGTVLPTLEKRLDLVDLVIYAGATWDWYRVHYDQAEAQRNGLPAPLVDGQMLGALLARQAISWTGPRGTVRRMAFRFKTPVIAGDTVRCEGTVTAVDQADGIIRVTLEQRVLCSDRVAVGPATTVVEIRS